MAHSGDRFDYEVAVIGGGSAGYAAARTAAAAGLSTVVIEGGEEVGGLCILRGCMPTKALLYAAEVLHLSQHAETWGVRVPQVTFDLAAITARKDALIREFADFRHQQLANGRFAFRRAKAQFTGPHVVQLSDGSLLTAAHFIIATGSRVAPCPFPTVAELGCLTSDDALSLIRLPRSMIVLGGGAVAVEFAQYFLRLGVEVTLIQRSAHILKEFDDDGAIELEQVFQRAGMRVFTNTQVVAGRRVGGLKEVEFFHRDQLEKVAAEEVLFALGRVPNTESLNLEAAGVTVLRERIVTNHKMETSAPHIYAVGDCAGPHEIVHIAIQQGETAARNAAGEDRVVDYRLLMMVIFTEPQLARVGLTEKEARAQNIPVLTASYRFADHGKALIMEARDGFVKLIADPVTGEILGGACVGPLGGELIHEIVAAMAKRMTVGELAAMPHYHPTLAEIWTYPAEELAEKIPGLLA